MMCSHTGGLMSFGHGAQHTKSSKQKLITKNSTEAKLVRVSEKLPYNIWIMNFLEYQVIVLEKSILYQDNQSAIYMEVNGRTSCTETPRHTDVWYFFVKERVYQGQMEIAYCLTEEMIQIFYEATTRLFVHQVQEQSHGSCPIAVICHTVSLT